MYNMSVHCKFVSIRIGVFTRPKNATDYFIVLTKRIYNTIYASKNSVITTTTIMILWRTLFKRCFEISDRQRE